MKRKIMIMKSKMRNKAGWFTNTSIVTRLVMLMMILSQITPVYAANIFEAVDGASGTVLNQITSTMNHSVFPITFVILVVLAIFNLSNQKVIDIVKQGFKWWLICFFALNGINIIFNTLTWIVGLVGGNTQVGGGVTGTEVVE